MRSLVGAGVLVMMTSALFAGCVEPVESDDDVDVEQPVFHTMGGGTSGGTNGLGDDDYWAVDASFYASTMYQLVAPGSNNVNMQIGALLLGSQAGLNVFHYAVQCAVPAGQSVVWNGVSYTGMGHLSLGARWLQGPLTGTAQGDLLACMVAHINPLGLSIPILLSGADINEDGLDHSEYTVDEALWVGGTGGAGGPTYTAYALQPLRNKCAADPAAALAQRVCGQNPASCSLQVGNMSDCIYNARLHTWTCAGKPAIKTTLKQAGFDTLYADCI